MSKIQRLVFTSLYILDSTHSFLLENHCADKPSDKQRNIVENEGGNTGIPDMVVLSIGIQTGSGA